jgi:DNA-binding NarL/FixJ family response regulator
MAKRRRARLTEHEQEILVLVGAGLDNHEIATRADMSTYAVGQAVRKIMQKLIARDGRQDPDVLGLTPREQEAAALMQQGKSDAEIAEALGISRRTAEVYAQAVLRKHGIPRRNRLREPS